MKSRKAFHRSQRADEDDNNGQGNGVLLPVWSTYLLRHGRNVAFYDWWEANPERWQRFERLAQKMDREHWKKMKKEALTSQSEQLKRFRFRHKREAFLTTLEERWAVAPETATLH